MSRVERNRGKNRQPYSWLGAGAVTLGLGAAMVGGTAVAFADTGTGPTDNSTGATASSSSAKAEAGPSRKRAGTRAARSATAAGNAAPAATTRNRASVTTPDLTPATETATVQTPAPLAAAAVAVPHRPARAPQKTAAASTTTASAASTPLPAATPPPPPSPSYNTDSYLPATPIVPGAHVAASLTEISQAQAALTAETWGAGNVFAGLAAIVPQLFLAEAALSLNAWQAVMPLSQQVLAATANIPILHQIAQVGVLASMTLPSFAGVGFDAAAFFLPVVSLLGAAIAPAEALVSQARSDGQVYAVVPIQMKATTEPTVDVKVNSGSATSVLIDSGSSGLLVTRDAVGSGDLGPVLGTGEVTFSGDETQVFHFTTYNAVVDLGGGAVTSPTPVNIVDSADAAAYKAFLAPAGVTGILGVGANTYGPNLPGDPIPNTALPGELGDGMLLMQDVFFGLFGVMVLGPNPLPTRVSVPGAPDANLKVSINGGAKQDAYGIIDSGGVYGTLPQYLINGGSSVPGGTVISVYTSDGSTLLYSYTASGSNIPTVIGDGDLLNPPLMNTGNTPFAQGAIYLNYGAPNRIGSTDFSIW